MNDPKQTFEEWLENVDAALADEIGLSHDDLADQPYRDWYDSGMDPEDAAKQAMENEGYDADDDAPDADDDDDDGDEYDGD